MNLRQLSPEFLAWLVANLIEYWMGYGSFLPSLSFLHLLGFALKPYFSQDFRVMIIFLVSFDALLNLTPPQKKKVKSCYNPLRLGTVIVLVSSGIDFVNTPRLYSDRATR